MISILMIATVATYSCEVDAPQRVDVKLGAATASEIGLPPDMNKRKFTIRLSSGRPIRASLSWPGDPMQISGEFPAISVGGGAYAFSTSSGGPCLFTETSCLSQVTLVDTDEAAANVIIVPSAITYIDETRQNREPFFVVIKGTCGRSGATR